MPRPKKATVDYFPHFVNHGETLFNIEAEFGNNGYAFWFKLLELLGRSEHHFYDCNNIKKWKYLLSKTRFSEEDANTILTLLAEIEAIDQEMWEDKIIWSHNFVSNLAPLYNRRDISPLTKPEIRDKCIHKLPATGVNADIYPQSKGEESKGEESTVLHPSLCDAHTQKPANILNKKETITNNRFEEFWALYPKKVGKKAAENTWRRLKVDADFHARIVEAISKAKKSQQWLKESGKYIPNPATWLNQGRWDDEWEEVNNNGIGGNIGKSGTKGFGRPGQFPSRADWDAETDYI